MEPSIIPGDYILVNKTAYGARLFDLFKAIEGDKVKIKRMRGFTHVKNNDIVVFHIPHPNTWSKIEMDMTKYFIKRCIGIPGDTLSIVNGVYCVNSDKSLQLGNLSSQRALQIISNKELSEGVYYTFPKDSVLNWNIKDFGPLYIPEKGDRVALNRTNALVYKKIIEWEKGYSLININDTIMDNGEPLLSYTFSHNYYFMGGDKVENSQDSRYWGLLPEELIVGKASLIWKSVDPYSGNIIRNRILKVVK